MAQVLNVLCEFLNLRARQDTQSRCSSGNKLWKLDCSLFPTRQRTSSVPLDTTTLQEQSKRHNNPRSFSGFSESCLRSINFLGYVFHCIVNFGRAITRAGLDNQ
ncbi:hypothetical protein RvY_18938 [Ramazzottius varieornatus]|uniref:Uncharacterized protein n=1 Tax=Ramazzottius varieornatus TaxID=947166 RepID=A0A1D1WBX4_RAMVA|nr:hypothetical protein RvY_18938 [Ramazzottius varieornatus]